MNDRSNISTLALILLVIFSCSSATFGCDRDKFVACLSSNSSYSSIVYTLTNSNYSSILGFSIQNLRFATDSTPKPHVIFTPQHESQIPRVIYCAKENDMEIRTRSGGHDYEGLSYTSKVPFVVVDLINLSEVTVDVEEKTAWVQSGATIGSLYYKIAEKSRVLGFPAGVCPTVGVGGHFSGGGYGTLLRKYGLAADHVIDARIVDVNGRILDRKSMGEDLFWAIRGGGGASFGVILAWKVRLVDVPERVTVFSVYKQNAIQLVHKWQNISSRIDEDLFMRVVANKVNKRNTTIRVAFMSIFLGGIERLLPLMKESFPELGLVRQQCAEMSWVQGILYFNYSPKESLGVLLNKIQPQRFYKATSDFVQKPIPEHGLEGLWRLFYEVEADLAEIIFTPYGGRMDEIPESAAPFPHRKGNLYMIHYWAGYLQNKNPNPERCTSWIRRVYSYMAPYVSTSPRAAYINYRDLDIGQGSTTSWGFKYFKNNFHRLVQVKTLVDPRNFFRNEQSIPPMHSKKRD